MGLLAESGQQNIKTYTLGFSGDEESDFDETALARLVAEQWGTKHEARSTPGFAGLRVMQEDRVRREVARENVRDNHHGRAGVHQALGEKMRGDLLHRFLHVA